MSTGQSQEARQAVTFTRGDVRLRGARMNGSAFVARADISAAENDVSLSLDSFNGVTIASTTLTREAARNLRDALSAVLGEGI